jgi:uncharacterized membrane protein YheB (UPF0754 family)
LSIRALRRLAIAVFPVLTVAGALGGLFSRIPWYDWVFKVALSGTVGIWTNHFAVRMLFRPRRRTVFGRQGLIPAKRAELAEAVGAAVAQRLLDVDSVLAYMEEEGLPEKAAGFVVDGVQRLAARPDVRAAVGDYLQGVLERVVERHSGDAVAKLQESVAGFLAEKTAPGKVWPAVREAVRRELDDPGARESVAGAIIAVADWNDTMIAAFVNEALDDFIDSKKQPGRFFLRMGKRVFRVDEEMIRREMRKKVGSPGFFDSVMSFLDGSAPGIEAWLDSPGVRAWFSGRLEEYRKTASEWVKGEGMALAAGKVREFLTSDSLWGWIMEQIDAQVVHLAALARDRINSPDFRSAAGVFVRKAVSGIDVQGMVRRKIDLFDLRELESLVLDVSGENLAAIELFGALLGALAGLVLIDVRFLPVIPASVLVFLAVENGLAGLAMKSRGRRKGREV